MIKNVVFDIGGVLTDYRLVEFLAEKGFDGTMIKRILKASIMSPYWDAFDRNDLTEDEALEAFASLDPEIKEDLFKAYNNIEGMLVPRDYAIPWVKSLKADGLNVYYLSNYSIKAFTECADSVAFMEFTDGGCLSHQEHLTKPDPEIYKRFLDKYDLNPAECIFIDDTKENVEIAVELGFKGIVFESQESAAAQIAEIRAAE